MRNIKIFGLTTVLISSISLSVNSSDVKKEDQTVPNSTSSMSTESLPKINKGIYRHYNQKFYELIGVAKHSENGETVVIYRELYDTFKYAVRPYSMFFENVTINNVEMPRFTFITDEEAISFIEKQQKNISSSTSSTSLESLPNITKGIYKHYNQKFYELIGAAKHSENGELLAVYRELYDTFKYAVRPYNMFFENVTVDDVEMPRFKFVTK